MESTEERAVQDLARMIDCEGSIADLARAIRRLARAEPARGCAVLEAAAMTLKTAIEEDPAWAERTCAADKLAVLAMILEKVSPAQN